MINIVETPGRFKVYLDILNNSYCVRVPYEIQGRPSYLQKDPARYIPSEVFQFEDELIFDCFEYRNTVKGASLRNRSGRKFHFHLKDFQKLLKSDKKFIDFNGDIVFPGTYSFKRHGQNNFCIMI